MKLLIAARNVLLVIAAALVLAAIPLSDRLEFDQRIESFFADDNPDLQMLKQSRTVFGGDEFVIVAWTEPRLFDIDGETYPPSLNAVLEEDVLLRVSDTAAERIRGLAEKLNQIPGVNSGKTQHLADFLDAAPRFKNSRRAMLRLFEGTLIGRDGQTTGILLELLPEQNSAVGREVTFEEIRKTASAFSADVAVAGEPVQVFDMFQLVEEDGQQLFLVSLVILSVVLTVMFRGLRWTLMPVGLVLGSVVATRAALYLMGAELSMVSSMLSSLVTVIGIATCMHVIVHYRDLRTEHPVDENSASGRFHPVAVETLKEMAAPVFWTCVTTAVGFGSLFVSQITPVRSFALMMCLGTAVVLVGCAVIFPATLASGSRLRLPAKVPLEDWLSRILHQTCGAVERHPVLSGILCLVLFVGAVPGVFRLQVETDFSRNFKDSSTIVQALRFVESRLGGAGSWEIAFDTPEQLTDRFLEDIQRLTDRLRSLTRDDDSIRVLSLTDVTDLPPRVLGPVKALERIQVRQPDLIRSFYREDQHRMRIVIRSMEQQNSESKLKQIHDVRRTVEEFFRELNPEPPANPTTSGMFIMLAELILSLLEDQLHSFVVATVGILICMTVAFGSLRIGILSLLPNIFPVAVLMGLLGWMGSPVNIGTAMITSVSMGITVDSTIHYITAFERARRNMRVTDALQVAHGGAGRALVFAYLALIAGFTVLTASRFVPLIYFGALLSLSMVGGIFGDLVLLPLLLRWTTQEQPQFQPSAESNPESFHSEPGDDVPQNSSADEAS
ncbi:MAG: MMPL family transporter [Planctomycetaceae bacterium]|nr:MMPL family transporter [Planctomycetaceae bacterium]